MGETKKHRQKETKFKTGTFSNFVYNTENLGKLRDSFVEKVNVHLHVLWRETEKAPGCYWSSEVHSSYRLNDVRASVC